MNNQVKATQIPSSTTPILKTGLVGSKRSRRIRSSGSSNDVKQIKKGRKAPGAKKGKGEAAIFLKKTYDMISKCDEGDESMASWTEDGNMFIIKDPDSFAKTVIPQYFDHNKFSSFNRQLNFYGFRKLQTEPILKSDIDQKKQKWITFHHNDFKRGRLDLLSNIKRSTRSDGTTAFKEQQKEIEGLNERVQSLEETVQKLCQYLDIEAPIMPALQDQEATRRISFVTKPQVEFEMDLKKSPADAKLEKMALIRAAQEQPASLAPHPRAKGHLPEEVNMSTGRLERGISQISLLRGLSSDPIWLQSGTSASFMGADTMVEERLPAE